MKGRLKNIENGMKNPSRVLLGILEEVKTENEG